MPRRDGAGYGSIATELGISINTVKSFCRRNSLTAPKTGTVCEECGKPITQNPGRKRKRFCSDACRNKWWNNHLNLVRRKANYTFTCPACGKEFMVYGDSHRKFCSHDCYIAYRFRGVRHG
ncbi:RNA polymerase subunit sigma-70 [Acidaminococcus fermentans DSM 20731]|uniref:RNA polymerase subunit sigma-70 n=1 Tax=Acidaminococcus fermentans TaxID=905 RepID=UPI0008FF358F|nr:RNA polymerase subunit sigma-70 [Acidaminococcus fermentans DSM 20731]